ncbi:hypothetical protein B9J78_01255 [bacterium Unc6]|nr:hypothetical protein [bacterium Unc6]
MEKDLIEKIEQVWKDTTIVKPSKRRLYTFSETRLPYILLAKSLVRDTDTVVRKGEVIVGRPILYRAGANHPLLEGFGDMNKTLNHFILSRLAYIPPYKYNNTMHCVKVISELQKDLIEKLSVQIDSEEDMLTAIIKGSPYMWEVSVMRYVIEMIANSLPSNITDLKEHGFL